MEFISILASTIFGVSDAKDFKFVNWNYLHGELQNWAQYDCFFANKIPDTDGLFSCIVQRESSKEVRFAYWFKWTDSNNRPHGLVVQYDDLESIDFAMKLYLEKVFAV